MGNVDVVALAESAFGKDAKDFTPNEQSATLHLASGVFELQRRLDKATRDSYMGMQVSEAEVLLAGEGFQLCWMQTRTSYHGYRERETIWARPDGLVVHMDSFGGTSINRFTLYGELVPARTDNNWYLRLNQVTCNGGSCGLYAADPDKGIQMDTDDGQFDADCRNGFRRILKLVDMAGAPKPVWGNKEKFIWFINYDEEHDSSIGDNINNYRRISAQKLNEGAPLLREITMKIIEANLRP